MTAERAQARVSLVGLAVLMSAALASGLDVRGALRHVGAAVGGEALDLVAVADALGSGVQWERAWEHAAPRLAALEPTLERSWSHGASPVAPLMELAHARIERARAAGERAAAELGVRLTLPLTLCLLPAFVAVGIVPLLLAVGAATVGEIPLPTIPAQVAP